MTDEQIVAAISTMLEYLTPRGSMPDASTIARRYRRNLHIASQPKDPNERPIEEFDQMMRDHDKSTEEKP